MKASSGRTRRSIFCGDAASKRELAWATFSGSRPNSGLNCRQAIRILRGKLEEGKMKLWNRVGEDQRICSPGLSFLFTSQLLTCSLYNGKYTMMIWLGNYAWNNNPSDEIIVGILLYSFERRQTTAPSSVVLV